MIMDGAEVVKARKELLELQTHRYIYVYITVS